MAVERFANILATPSSDADDNGLVGKLGAAVATAPAAGTVENWTLDRTVTADLRGGTVRCRVDNELIIVTVPSNGVSPVSVKRGVEGSSTATHAINAKIRNVWSAGSVGRRADVIRDLWIPPGVISESFPRAFAGSEGTMESGRIYQAGGHVLRKGQVATGIKFCTGFGGPMGGATHQWFALYSAETGTPLLAISADDTNAAWPASTFKTLNFTVPYVVPRLIPVYACLLIVATTMPTYRAYVGRAEFNDQSPVLSTRSNSNTFTTPASAPATLAGEQQAGVQPYVLMSQIMGTDE